MKKLLSTLFVLLLGLSICSCSTNASQEIKQTEEPTDEPSIGMPNPIKQYDSIKDINGKTGVNMIIPPSVPATDIVYSTISDEIAQIDFKLDNHRWIVRGSKTVDQDISGIHNENNVFNSGEDFGLYTNDYYIDRFFKEGFQFTIVMETGGEYYDETIFGEYVFDLETALKNASDPNKIAGSYADSVSQRATMNILKFDNLYDITVIWPDSASKETQWYISASYKDGKLAYGGEQLSIYEYDEEGNMNFIDSKESNYAGYFEVKDGKIYWTGAEQDQCKECIFEKMY